MKKVLLSILSLLALAMAGHAQGTANPGNLINETFDTFPPDEWTSEGYWMSAADLFNRLQTNVIPKNNDVLYATFDAVNGNDPSPYSLITPPLAPTAQDHILSYEVTEFMLDPQYFNAGIQLFVEVSTNDGSSWTNSTDNVLTGIPGHNTVAADRASVDLTLDLNAYIDQVVRVRFRAISDYGAFILALDNVTGVPLNVPTDPDLEITNPHIDVAALYTPLRHVVGILPEANVKNKGTDMTNTAILNFAITPGSYSQNVTIPVISYRDSELVKVPPGNGFSPTASGAYSLTASTNFSDPTPDNNSASISFHISDDFFAMDNGNYQDGIGSNFDNITFGNLFELKQEDIIHSFILAFDNIADTEFKLKIYSVDDAISKATQIYESSIFNRNMASAENTLTEFDIDPQQLPAGKYIFCINQFNSITIRCCNDNASNGLFYIIDSDGKIFPQTTYGNIAVRIKTTPVTAINPEKNETDVEINVPVTVTFLQNMTAATLSDISISPDPGGVTANINNNILTIAHTDFAYDTEYTVTIPSTALNELVSDFSFSFTTKPDPNACNVPTKLNATNINYNDATLSWQENGPATEWNIKYGPTGFDIDTEGSLVAAVTNNTGYQLTGLADGVIYDYYVQSICGQGGSNWAGPYTFSTPADCSLPVTNFPWHEGFEDGSLPSCWTVFNQGQGGSTWELNATDTYIHTGTGSIGHKYSDTGDQEGWLVTRKISIPSTGTYFLKFWSNNRYPRDYEKNSVCISTGSNDPAENDFIEKWTTDEVNNHWVETRINLSADYAGQDIYIGFKYEGNDAHEWYIDDVSIEDLSNVIDAEVIEISAPRSGGNLSATETVKVIVKNNGGDPITGFDLKLEVDGAITTETVTASIDPLDTYEYTFTATADLSAEQDYTVKVTVVLSGDSDATNDVVEKTVTNYGDIITISDSHQDITRCGIRFWDDGGFGNYTSASSGTQTITFFPETTGDKVKVEFLELNIVPYQVVMIWDVPGDTLFVYEGAQQDPNNLLASYTGDYTGNLPEAITSSGTDGALTFAFKKSSGASEAGWLANISCVTPPEKDASVTSILSPTTVGSTNATVKVVLKNYGRTPITSMPVAYQLNSGTPVTELYTGNILPGGTDEFTFNTTVDLSAFDNYTLKVYTQLTGDMESSNDNRTVQIRLKLFGYRVYDDIDPLGVVSFHTETPGSVTSVSSYRDVGNTITGGEYYNGMLYLFSQNSLTHEATNFIQLNTATWTATTSSVSQYCTDMAYDYSSDTMYGVVLNQNDLSDLCTVDLANGTLTGVASTDKYFYTLACNLSGELFGVAEDGNMYRIDKTTATTILVGSTGISPVYIQSMAFDHHSGRLFWAMRNTNEGRLIELDPADGSATDLGKLGGNAEIVALYTPYKKGDITPPVIPPPVVEPPVILSYSPEPGSTITDKEVPVYVTFNKAITKSIRDKVIITYNNGQSQSEGVTSYAKDNTFIIDHSPFGDETEYTVTIPKGTIVNYDNAISWSFTLTQPTANSLIESLKEIRIYPNPARTEVNLENLPQGCTITLIDMSGKIIGKYRADNYLYIPLNVSSGIYLIKIDKGNKSVVRKLIVQ